VVFETIEVGDQLNYSTTHPKCVTIALGFSDVSIIFQTQESADAPARSYLLVNIIKDCCSAVP